jgi:NAD(P)-dependent dehydrogenase (short-subunit alcohol dehydrogenase family)
MSGLTGRVALVTGANRGLGLEAARQLAALGALVLLGARDRDKAVAAAQAIGAPADRGVLLDVTRAETVDACATFIDRTLGRRLDILVNNAAIHYDARQTPLSADLEIIREAYETNVIGAWRLAQMAARFMRPRRWGRIVNVSSEAGSLASMHASAPAYRASKLALNGLTLMLPTSCAARASSTTPSVPAGSPRTWAAAAAAPSPTAPAPSSGPRRSPTTARPAASSETGSPCAGRFGGPEGATSQPRRGCGP